MGKAKSPLPDFLKAPMYYAIRAGLAGLGAVDLPASIRAARSLGRFYAAGPGRARRARAEANLQVACPHWTDAQRREYAILAYEHLLQLAVEMVNSQRLLSPDAWSSHVRIGNLGDTVNRLLSGRPAMLVTGHVGNWELLAYILALLGFPVNVLYRRLDLAPLDEWVRNTRQRRGLVLLDKFGAVRGVPRLLQMGAPVGFAADQNAGDRGLFVPFFNRLASTYKSIGLMAIRFDAPIVCGMARRLVWERDGRTQGRCARDGEGGGVHAPRRLNGQLNAAHARMPAPQLAQLADEWSDGASDLGFMEWSGEPFRYRVDVVDIIRPEDWCDQPDPLFYVTARYRRAIERMVRLAPEQYLWMHRYWKSRPRHERAAKPFPGALKEKILQLPWTTPADMEAIEEWSRRDTLEARASD